MPTCVFSSSGSNPAKGSPASEFKSVSGSKLAVDPGDVWARGSTENPGAVPGWAPTPEGGNSGAAKAPETLLTPDEISEEAPSEAIEGGEETALSYIAPDTESAAESK